MKTHQHEMDDPEYPQGSHLRRISRTFLLTALANLPITFIQSMFSSDFALQLAFQIKADAKSYQDGDFLERDNARDDLGEESGHSRKGEVKPKAGRKRSQPLR